MNRHRTSFERNVRPPSNRTVHQETLENKSRMPFPSTSRNQVPTVTSNPQQVQTTIFTFFKRPVIVVREKKLNDSVLNMKVKALQPFSIVEAVVFRFLTYRTSKLNK